MGVIGSSNMCLLQTIALGSYIKIKSVLPGMEIYMTSKTRSPDYFIFMMSILLRQPQRNFHHWNHNTIFSGLAACLDRGLSNATNIACINLFYAAPCSVCSLDYIMDYCGTCKYSAGWITREWQYLEHDDLFLVIYNSVISWNWITALIFA